MEADPRMSVRMLESETGIECVPLVTGEEHEV